MVVPNESAHDKSYEAKQGIRALVKRDDANLKNICVKDFIRIVRKNIRYQCEKINPLQNQT